MRNGIMFQLALILIPLACPVRAADWVGLGQVVDGQTLVINGQRLRLSGIEAIGDNRSCYDFRYNPYPCGWLARSHLGDLILNKQVTCSGDARDENQTPMVRCAIGDLNLNREMVRAGWATSQEYRAEQDLAQREKVGMWQRSGQ